MTTAKATEARRRGEIEKLPSGSLRVRVYAGIDPVTGKKYHLTEFVPPGPRAAKEAEKVRTRLLAQVDAKRNPRTRATVSQLLERHLEMLSVEATTLDSYETFIRNHIRPLIGDVQVGRIDGEILDSFYKQLRTCRSHCRGKKFVQHYVKGDHKCDKRCKPHVCRPLAAGSLRKIQAILNGAGKRAVRWGWLGRNPFELSEPIAAARPDPQPPTAEQAAVIAAEAWRDLGWGMLVWLAMTSGARRGELCRCAGTGSTSSPRCSTFGRASVSAVPVRGRRTPRPTSSGASRSTRRRLRCWRPTVSTAPNASAWVLRCPERLGSSLCCRMVRPGSSRTR
jgi:hypothetical protein